eukprot:gene9271-6639_t
MAKSSTFTVYCNYKFCTAITIMALQSLASAEAALGLQSTS